MGPPHALTSSPVEIASVRPGAEPPCPAASDAWR
ncbi:Uncharacterised protein [Mycobacteroides abscessus]|nr:Uncharacterised protein [Mycobacteroides abscessus]